MMLGGIVSFLGGMFSSSKMQDTAVDAIRKLGGLDQMSDKEKSDFILQYMEVTKHQSPARRFIAMSVLGVWMVFMLVWLVAAGIGQVGEIQGVMLYADAVRGTLADSITNPFTVVLSFYFVMNIAGKVGGKK